MDALRAAGLTANPRKSKIRHKQVVYLGFEAGDGRVKALKDKVEVLRSTPLSANKEALQRFLGVASYYWRDVPCFTSRATVPSEMLMKKRLKILHWTPQTKWTFEDVRDSLCQGGV